MKINGFFAMVSRMKYINRWALMRNSRPENLSEHSTETAALAHALVTIHNRRFGGSLNAERAALLGLYHDLPESLTGDMPTPVKYYSEQVRSAYATVEDASCRSLLTMLPEDLRQDYEPFFFKDERDAELWQYVKAADKLSAFIKCMEEKKAGNSEFDRAAEQTLANINALNMPEVDCFMAEFIPAYGLTLDELK